MFEKVLRTLFGDPAAKELKKLQPYLDEILEIYPSLEAFSDDEIRERINVIRGEIQEKVRSIFAEIDKLAEAYQRETDEREQTLIGNEMDALKKKAKVQVQDILDDYLPEVYAIIKDTCRRLVGSTYLVRGHEVTWDMVPFDVQLIGGIALHKGMITEMATGEGKTLVATMPLFLNALTGRNVHLVTVNDYLAQRDSEWMSPIFAFHGVTIGVIITRMDFDERQQAYSCDVTYGMNSEFGFDYLRDNMAVSPEQVVQRGFYYAIVDEVDSILIDEARTPLIISGPVAQDKNYYDELRTPIVQLVGSQNTLVNRLLSEVRQALNSEKPDYDIISKNLLLVQRAAPKNKAFLKMMSEGDLKKIVNDTEGIYLRDKKLHELDNELFYVIDEKANSADLAEKGRDVLSRSESDLFVLESLDDSLKEVDEDTSLSADQKTKKKESVTSHFLDKTEKLHNISQLLKAYSLFEKDVDYVINDNQVVIVDEFTGRMMPGRRFSDGLHQALEAKENVRIEGATQTFATITLQNYFRMFDKLAGMTGTAITEESEFMEIYKLPVLPIPTNRPVSRHDHEDVIYLTKNEKYNAIIDEIDYWYNMKKPVLVGTVSVEVSETLSRLLRRKKIDHNILNAKNHEREAEIIMDAGRAGAVTIATNMAGRGTDIKLGETVVTEDKEFYLDDPWKVTETFQYGKPLDGLHVIGSERHESRRIDRQLRGRAGRQGDPGTSRFYLSLEDDLMRLFGSDRIAPMLMKFGVKEGEAITHPWMTGAVEKAQRRVEEHNFEIRKQLIKYDEVMNQQREVIYT
ncbi:MAG TPA: preprotein translocase subunit SecA, partial [Candidatus Cloacimonadota bacterium]|nr:preprotein translocase subunit SecA [Candidatus Cloacimonadota bacterium]